MTRTFEPLEGFGTRIDRWLAGNCPDMSRAYIQKLIEAGGVLVDGEPVKSKYQVCPGDEIEIEIPECTDPEILPEDIPLDIVYEDKDLILVNKPKGMVVHPAPGHYTGTLVNGLMHHCGSELSGINGVARPGIVHRIDRDTTGVLVICKNDIAHRKVAEQLAEHSITRKYRGIVHGVLKEETGTIEGNIARHPTDRKKMAVVPGKGKEAITHYRVLDIYKNFTYAEFQLETGRTHQIRVHMASVGHPLLGDEVYGPAKCPYKLEGQTLHAMTLGFVHPSTGKYVEFEAPLPGYFSHLLDILPR